MVRRSFRGHAALALFAVILAPQCGFVEIRTREEPRTAAHEPPPNVVLISIDTLRADRLGSYGNTRPFVSPFLDRLADEGVRFEQAISQAPWTIPSHMSMFTSMVPSSHRVNQTWDHFVSFLDDGDGFRVLPDHVTTLTEALQDKGYRTFALTGGATMAESLGFDQGFEVYERRPPPNLHEWEVMLDFLDRGAESEPFFFFLHTFEVHAPYTRLGYAEPLLDRATLKAMEETCWFCPEIVGKAPELLQQHGVYNAEMQSHLYDGGIRHADMRIGLLFDEMRRRGLYENTLIVVTSDHGEEFADHDPDRFYNAHCISGYDELLHVPLIMKLPGGRRAGTVVPDQVELIDLAPTILEAAGAQTPAAMQGTSLLPLTEGARREAPQSLTEASCYGPEIKTLRTGAHKYIVAYPRDEDDEPDLSAPPEWELLFDLKADPGEHDSLHESEPELLETLRAALQDRLQEAAAHAVTDSPSIEMSDKQLDRLRSLGYIQ